jgi:maltase-glucoamylase
LIFDRFPRDSATYSIDRQFLIGPAILITPVIDEGKTSVLGYFPKDNWYSYYDGKKEHKYDVDASWKNINAPIDFIPIHIRGGYIIPTQAPANNTVYSRKNSFGLIVALDWDGEARGDLYYDEGESKNFEQGEYYYSTFNVYSNTLKMEIEHNNYTGMNFLKLDTITIFVENNQNISFELNRKEISENNIQRFENKVVLKTLSLPMNTPLELKWFTYKVDLNATRIDCSIENFTISRTDCIKKNCTFDDTQATERVPKCFIPKHLGGYQVKNASNNHFELSRADNFSLYGNEIENLVIDTIYGNIDGKFDLVRIKVIKY